MTNGRIDDAQIDLMLADLPRDSAEWKRERYTLTATAETRSDIATLRGQVASIRQHCRFCDDSTDTSESDDKRVWALWGVAKVVLAVLSPVAATIITLAVTGQLGG